jgi:hypothetical protein
MLTKFIRAATARATYEILEDDRACYGEIPGLQGAWASAAALDACRSELESVLEVWLLYGLQKRLPIPVLDEIDLNQPQPELV